MADSNTQEKKIDVPTDSNPLGLDEAEIDILDSQVAMPTSTAGYWAIYKYADRLDIFFILASLVFAAAAGAATPLMTVRLFRRILPISPSPPH